MKSEQRHELHDNDLAESVQQLAERARPYLSTILIAAIGGLVAVIVGVVVSSRWEASRAESWDACLAALTTGDENGFREVIIRYTGTPAAQWAELVLADRNLSEATDLLFAPLDPANDVARQRLENVVDTYTAILAERPSGMVAERATLGLAKARESLGQLEEARLGYDALASEYTDSPLASLAAAHAADLARDDTQAFYAWFAEQRQKAAEKPEPASDDTDAAPTNAAAESVPADGPESSEAEPSEVLSASVESEAASAKPDEPAAEE